MNIIVYSTNKPTLAAGDVSFSRNPAFWRGEVEKVDAIYPCDRHDIMAAYAAAGVAVYEQPKAEVKATSTTKKTVENK